MRRIEIDRKREKGGEVEQDGWMSVHRKGSALPTGHSFVVFSQRIALDVVWLQLSQKRRMEL